MDGRKEGESKRGRGGLEGGEGEGEDEGKMGEERGMGGRGMGGREGRDEVIGEIWLKGWSVDRWKE